MHGLGIGPGSWCGTHAFNDSHCAVGRCGRRTWCLYLGLGRLLLFWCVMFCLFCFFFSTKGKFKRKFVYALFFLSVGFFFLFFFKRGKSVLVILVAIFFFNFYFCKCKLFFFFYIFIQFQLSGFQLYCSSTWLSMAMFSFCFVATLLQ